MGQGSYSRDLRDRVVAAFAAGSSRREAARRFRVSASSAVRWVARHRDTGSAEAKPRGGRSRSPLEPHAAWLKGLLAKEMDLTLAQIKSRLFDELGVYTTKSSIDRFFTRHRITFKKNAARRRTGAAGRGPGTHDLEEASGQP